MDKKKMIELISTFPDFINLPKYNNSLAAFIKDHPDGTSDTVICKALCLTQEELDILLSNAIMKLRESVGEDGDS